MFVSTLGLVAGSFAMAACSGSSTMMVIDDEDAASEPSSKADGGPSSHADAAHATDGQLPSIDGSHDVDASTFDASHFDGSTFSDANITDGSHTDSSASDGSIDLDAGNFSDCAPATLHPVNSATDGVFCPFAVGGTATGAFCSTGQFCCKPLLSPSVGVCTDPGAGGANPCAPVTDESIQCDDSIQCSAGNGGTQCCGNGTVLQDPVCAGTAAYFGSAFTGTKCQPSCAPAQLQMCSQASGECGGGASCRPFKAKGSQFAACL